MEMLIVVAIIAILIAIAIPAFNSALNKARAATCAANRRSMLAEIKVAQMMDNSLLKHTDNQQFSQLWNKCAGECTCPKGGKFTAYYDKEGYISYISCDKHPEETLSAPEFSNTVFANDTVNKYYNEKNRKKNGATLDSTGINFGQPLLADIKKIYGDSVQSFQIYWKENGSTKEQIVMYSSSPMNEETAKTGIKVTRYDAVTGKTQTGTVQLVTKTDSGKTFYVMKADSFVSD